MARIFGILGIVLVMGCSQAYAQNNMSSDQNSGSSSACYNSKIVNMSGLVITTGTGLIYQAYPGSGPAVAFWSPLDRITVCRIGGSAVEITNLNRKNEVKALRKSN